MLLFLLRAVQSNISLYLGPIGRSLAKSLEYRATKENLIITYQPSGNGGGETVGPACGGVWEGTVPESAMMRVVEWKGTLGKVEGKHGSVKGEKEKRYTGDLRCATF